jgi:uncharacterized protein
MRARDVAALAAAIALAVPFASCLKRSKLSSSYALDPLPAGAASPAEAQDPTGPVVGIERVSIPDWLDRMQVTGRATSGAIVSDDYSRWAEPLPRGIQRVLAEDLVVLLPDRRILTAPFAPRDVIAHRLELTLVEAARQPDGSVLVEARWEVLGPAGEILARRRSTQRSSPTALGAAGAVQGLNAALTALSREIADVLRSLPAPAR